MLGQNIEICRFYTCCGLSCLQELEEVYKKPLPQHIADKALAYAKANCYLCV